MKTAIVEDLLRLGKEAGLKSFEQVTVAMLDLILKILHFHSAELNHATWVLSATIHLNK